MSRKYKFRDNSKLYFISFSVVYWLDVFIRNEYKEILLDSWRYCMQHKGLEIYAWCIMTSHVHMIIGSKGINLADIVRDMKSFTSTSLRKAINEHPQESRKEWLLWMMKRAGEKNGNNKDFQFWQQHNQPIELSSNDIMQQRLDYLHHNTVEAGFVEEPEQWLYSSARDYAGIKGLLPVTLIE
jgi:putative transposase